MDDTLLIWRDRLLHWLTFVLIASAAVLGVGGCGDPGHSDRQVSFPTDRTLVFKVRRHQAQADSFVVPLTPGFEARAQFVGSSTNASDIRRIIVRVFNDTGELSGVHRQAAVDLPPFVGTLVLRAVRPGRKLVRVEALSATGASLFTGSQVVDFTPGSARFVEFILTASPPASSSTFTGGPIDTDTRLVRSQSPYTVTTPIVVAAGAALVVEPGVEIRFATATTEPDVLVRGRLLLGAASGPAAVLRRVTGRSAGSRLRFENAGASTITSADISGTLASAVEISGGRLTITSSAFSDATTGVLAIGASPVIAGNRFSGIGTGVALRRSSALVESNRFTNPSTGVAAFDSSIIVFTNVIEAQAGVVVEGVRVERSAATVSSNRLRGTTATFDPGSGRLTNGLDLGIVVADSVSGTAAVSQRVEIDHNTIDGASTAGIASIASDPLVTFNRVLNGSGGGQAGSQGITINRASTTFPKQPLITSNEIADNTGPAVGFLLDARLQPGGGGVLGSAGGREGNFIRGNNIIGLGFAPGVDTQSGGAVDGVFNTRTLQVFSVDAILATMAAPIAGAGAPASVR